MSWQSGVWVPAKGFEQCRFVSDGEIVWAPYGNKGTAIRCTVQVAAGNHAFVVNENRNFAKWFDVLELYRRADPW